MRRKGLLLIVLLLCNYALVAINQDSLFVEAKKASGEKALQLWTDLGDFYVSSYNDSLYLVSESLFQVNAGKSSEVLALKYKAIWLYQKHQYDSSIVVCHQGYELASSINLNELSIDFEHTRGLNYLALAYYDNAEFVASLVESTSDSIDYIEGQINANILLSNLEIKRNDFVKATEYAIEAFEFAKQTQNKASLLIIHQLLGNIQLHQADYSSSLENYLKALTYATELTNTSKEAGVLNNIGVVHSYMGNSKQAESYYLKAKSIRSQLGDAKGVAGSLVSLGNLWVKASPLRAKPYYEEALAVYRDVGDQQLLAQTLNNIANFYYYSGDYKEALVYGKEALRIQRALENKREISMLLMNAGYSYMQLGQGGRALENMKLSLQMAKETNDTEQLSASLIALGDVHEQLGDETKALVYRNRYISFKDSISSNETARKVAELEVRYKTQLKEQQIEALTKESELKELKLKQNQVVIAKQRSQLVFFASFFFLFILMIYGSYKRLKLRKQRELDEVVIKEQQAGLKAVVSATESERKRIAKDLHDGIAQTLSGVKLGLDQLWSELKFDSEMQRKRYQQTLEYLSEACNEVREISHQMMPRVLSKMGLVQAINDFLDKSLGHTRFNYSFEYFGFQSNERFAESVEVNVFRITQELVQNVIKHSGATQLKATLIRDKSELVLNVEDNGIGLELESTSIGMGLDSVKGRVSSLHGSVSFKKAQNTGLIVNIRIPIDE